MSGLVILGLAAIVIPLIIRILLELRSEVVQRETEKLKAENETLKEEIANLKDCL